MSVLYKHGKELFRKRAARYDMAYMEDGTIHKNSGHGFKLYARVKPGSNPVEVINKIKEKHNNKRRNNPHYAAFVDAVRDCGSLKKCGLLVTALDVLGDDIDGIYVELDDWPDTRGYFSIEDITHIHGLYTAALKEAKSN